MTVLKDCELHWPKLDPKNPVSPFGTPVWELQVRTRDKEKAKGWKEVGCNVKTTDDDEGIYYFINLKRKAIYEKTDTPATPVIVVGADVMPLDPTSIGNGSVGHVQLYTKPYDFAGKKGIKIELKAVQVTKLVEFRASGGGSGLAFTAVGETEVISTNAAASEVAGSDDLWD
jgi:hypothetical protein